MARRRRDAPDPTPPPDPTPAQQPAPAPDSAWAEKLAHAVAQARTQVDALTAAQAALATSTTAAQRSQAGLAAALANVAAQSRKGAPGATPPASGGGAGQPPPAAAPPGATGGPGRGSLVAPPAGLGAAVAQAARSQQVLGDAAASAAAKTGTLARSQGGLAGAVGGASDAMGRMASGSRSAADAGGKLAQSAQAVKGQSEKMATAGLAVAGAYAYASSKLLSFVKAGLAGTTAGEALSFQFNQLQRSVAEAFLPVVESVIRRLQTLTQFFRGLSGEQQENVRRWTGITIGALGFMTLVPKLVGGLMTVGAVLKAAALSNPFLLAAGAIAALLARTEEGRSSLAEMGKTLMDAFGKLAEILGEVLVPIVQALTDALSGPVGKFLLIGALVAGVMKMVGAWGLLRTAIMATGATATVAFGILTAGLAAAVAGIIALVNRTKQESEALKEAEDIGYRLRKGQITKTEARGEVEEKVGRKRYEIERAAGRGDTEEAGNKLFDLIRQSGASQMEAINKLTKMQAAGLSPAEMLEQVLGEFRTKLLGEAFAGGKGKAEGKDRSQLVSARSGQEDPAAVLRRLEEATLRTDIPKQQLEKTTELNDNIKGLWDFLKQKLGGNTEPRPSLPAAPPVLP
jgi:hypothetical protein